MLPKLDGISVCRELRSTAHLRAVPVIMVTAKGQEEDVVLGLEAGADDYVIKPFGVKVLLARVKAALRRAPPSPDGRIVLDGLVIDPERHAVTVEGTDLSLTATEFRILRCLASRPGRVFTRDQLVDRAIGRNALVTDRNIDVHVGAVRKKLGEHRDLIETVRGVGYRFRDR
jgi:two-component system phosphate regulon response regulator PhoB